MVTSSNSAIWVNCSHVTSGQNYLPSHGTLQMFHPLDLMPTMILGESGKKFGHWIAGIDRCLETLGRGAIADVLLGKMLLFVGLLVGGLIGCPV